MKPIEKHIPFEATHPGSLLKEELDARNINQIDLGIQIGLNKTILNEIIKGKRAITADIALLLERALEIPADYWMRFQSQYEIDLARVKEKNIQKLANIDIWKIIKEYVPVNYFRKIGYFIDDLSCDILKIKAVYEINTIDELVNKAATNKFSYFKKSEKLQVNENNMLAWHSVAKYEAKQQEVNSFNPANIPNLVQELQTIFYQNKNVVTVVQKKLNQYGIKFVLIKKIEQTPIDGYTFWSNNNPTIALTLRHNRIDNFAFTIMHELGHIDLHLKKGKEQQFFELSDKNTHLDQVEKEANNYAQEKLISHTIWAQIGGLNEFSDSLINQYAKKHKIHPAIILGRINKEREFYGVKTSIDKKLN